MYYKGDFGSFLKKTFKISQLMLKAKSERKLFLLRALERTILKQTHLSGSRQKPAAQLCELQIISLNW